MALNQSPHDAFFPQITAFLKATLCRAMIENFPFFATALNWKVAADTVFLFPLLDCNPKTRHQEYSNQLPT